jgi:hypothetical protein
VLGRGVHDAPKSTAKVRMAVCAAALDPPSLVGEKRQCGAVDLLERRRGGRTVDMRSPRVGRTPQLAVASAGAPAC